MARGGVRQGAPGGSYPNRSDLAQGVRVAPGGQYGSGVQSANAQKAMPLPQQGPLAPPGSVPFDAPTQRPNEPVTTGLPIGEGAGPSALTATADDDVAMKIQALYQQFPNNDLLRLLELHNQGY